MKIIVLSPPPFFNTDQSWCIVPILRAVFVAAQRPAQSGAATRSYSPHLKTHFGIEFNMSTLLFITEHKLDRHTQQIQTSAR